MRPPKPHPEVEAEHSSRSNRLQVLCNGPNLIRTCVRYWPRRIRSSRASVSGSSRSRSWAGRSASSCTGSRSCRKVCEVIVCTCRPAVPRTAESVETTQTGRGARLLRREPLEQLVGVLGVAHLERADRLVAADPVVDEHAVGALGGDEAREQVAQLARVGELAGVEEVVAVEQVEGRLRHRAGALPRRGAGSGDADVERLDPAERAGSRSPRRRCGARAGGSPCPRRRRRGSSRP